MRSIRQDIGGLGNLMFKEAFLTSEVLDGHLPDVYLQNYNLWNHNKEAIKQKFSQGIGDEIDKVSLHIRRGDYLNPEQIKFHVNLCDTDYYQRATALFPDDTFLVFCKDNLLGS